MAVFGHSGSHAPQLMHSSVISVDILQLFSAPHAGCRLLGGKVGAWLDLKGKNIGGFRTEQVSASAYAGIAATMRLASSLKAKPAGCEGSLMTSGIPSSPARRSSV